MTAAPFVKPEAHRARPVAGPDTAGRPELPRLDVSLLPGWAGDLRPGTGREYRNPARTGRGMVLATTATAAARTTRLCVPRATSSR
jgi:hypothetical protein